MVWAERQGSALPSLGRRREPLLAHDKTFGGGTDMMLPLLRIPGEVLDGLLPRTQIGRGGKAGGRPTR